MNAFSKEEMDTIHSRSACIVGCGGLGGHAAMCLARFGIGSLTLVDGDAFATSNLNRQVFCTESNIGENKAAEAKKALQTINSEVKITVVPEMLDEKNLQKVLAGHDAVIDCLDNIPSRLLLEAGCKDAGTPFIHGAIGGFYGQVCCVFPGDDILAKLYADSASAWPENDMGNPPFTPQLVAAVQCSEALKLLAGRPGILRNKLLFIDLEQNSFSTIDLDF